MNHLQDELKFFMRLGYAVTASGQISQRDPDNSDHWWIPTLGNKSVACLDINGNIISSSHKINFTARAFHAEIYRDRPDVNAVVHFHPDNVAAWSMIKKEFLFTTTESALFYNDIVQADIAGLITGDNNGHLVSKYLGSKNTLIIQNHGPVTVGKTLESALWRTILLEKICQINLMALAVAQPQQLNEAELLKAHSLFAKESAMNYQYKNFKETFYVK